MRLDRKMLQALKVNDVEGGPRSFENLSSQKMPFPAYFRDTFMVHLLNILRGSFCLLLVMSKFLISLSFLVFIAWLSHFSSMIMSLVRIFSNS